MDQFIQKKQNQEVMGRKSQLKKDAHIHQEIAALLEEFNLGLMSRAWESKRMMEDDPLIPYLESGWITPAKHRYIWAFVDCNWLLWELVQSAERFIQAAFREGGISYFKGWKAIDFFKAIVSTNLTGVQEQRELSYFEFSAPKMEKFCRTGVKLLNFELSTTEQEKIVRVLKQNDPNKVLWHDDEFKTFSQNPLFFILMAVCQEKKQSTVGDRYERFTHSLRVLNEAQATVLRQAKSYSIVKGQKKEGTKKGGTYS